MTLINCSFIVFVVNWVITMEFDFGIRHIKFSDRKAYYEAFDSYHVKGDIKPMVNLFSKYLLERLQKYISIIE